MELSTTSVCLGEVREVVGGRGGAGSGEAFLPQPCAVRFCPAGMRIRGGIAVRPLAPRKGAVAPEVVEEERAAKRKLTAVEADEDVELDCELDEEVGQFAASLPKRRAGGVLTVVEKAEIDEQGETSTESELAADELEPGAAPRAAEV